MSDRFEKLGPSIEERIQSPAYLAIVRQVFRTWDRAETEDKRRYVANLLANAAGSRICSDDVVRLFISWLDLYHEAHFAVIREIFKNPGSSRYDIWSELYGDLPREDSAEADLYKLLIRDLSTGGVIRQAAMLSTPRTLFALAADGFLPRPLALVHPQHRTPHVAIAVQGVIVCVIALTGTYVRLALVADVAILLVYLACCVSAWRLRRLNAGSEGKPFLMPAGRVVPWVAAALIVGLLARAKPEAWLLTGAVAAAASLLFLAQRRRGR